LILLTKSFISKRKKIVFIVARPTTTYIKDCKICLQEEKAKLCHQANSILNIQLFTMALADEDIFNNKSYLNSKAIQHMMPHFKWFVSYTKNLTKDKIYLKDNLRES